MPFRSPVADQLFVLDHIVGYGGLAETARFAGADRETAGAVLTEASRLCDEILAPLRRAGDTDPARLENGVVRTPAGFAEAYGAIAEGGWVGAAADPVWGGLGLPVTLQTAVSEMMSGANLALQICPLLTQGQIEALEHHASDALKALYLPKLTSGAWTGTMTKATAPTGSVGRRSTSPTAITTWRRMSVIWCSRGCPAPRRGPRGSACFWCPSGCPTRRAGQGSRTG